jgi:hypothetical protein
VSTSYHRQWQRWLRLQGVKEAFNATYHHLSPSIFTVTNRVLAPSVLIHSFFRDRSSNYQFNLAHPLLPPVTRTSLPEVKFPTIYDLPHLHALTCETLTSFALPTRSQCVVRKHPIPKLRSQYSVAKRASAWDTLQFFHSSQSPGLLTRCPTSQYP